MVWLLYFYRKQTHPIHYLQKWASEFSRQNASLAEYYFCVGEKACRTKEKHIQMDEQLMQNDRHNHS